MVNLPQSDASLEEVAGWWRDTGRDLQRKLSSIRNKLQDAMIQGGDLPGLGLEFTYEYMPDTAAEFPHLVKSRSITAEIDDEDEFQRCFELLLEQVPKATFTTGQKIDGHKANQVLLRGGRDGTRLQELRQARPRLIVK